MNKVRKEKEMQRKQHPKDVKKQRDKTTTENEEEPGGKEALEEENLPEKSKKGKQEEEKQLTRVKKPKKKEEGSSNQEKINPKLQLTDTQIEKKEDVKRRNQYLQQKVNKETTGDWN